jgi:pyruvate,water dikinase
MCEIPSDVILGSNDLTKLTLGVDGGSRALAHLFSEEDSAVTALIKQVIEAAHRKGVHIGLCGQGASNCVLSG